MRVSTRSPEDGITSPGQFPSALGHWPERKGTHAPHRAGRRAARQRSRRHRRSTRAPHRGGAVSAGALWAALTEPVVAPLDPAVRLVIIEVLREALDVVTGEIAPGSAHLRLRGRDPDIVVTPPPVRPESANRSVPEQHREGAAEDLTEGPVSRINFRPPESLNGPHRAGRRPRAALGQRVARAGHLGRDRRGRGQAVDEHPQPLLRLGRLTRHATDGAEAPGRTIRHAHLRHAGPRQRPHRPTAG
jgi:hypothetical protein